MMCPGPIIEHLDFYQECSLGRLCISPDKHDNHQIGVSCGLAKLSELKNKINHTCIDCADRITV